MLQYRTFKRLTSKEAIKESRLATHSSNLPSIYGKVGREAIGEITPFFARPKKEVERKEVGIATHSLDCSVPWFGAIEEATARASQKHLNRKAGFVLHPTPPAIPKRADLGPKPRRNRRLGV